MSKDVDVYDKAAASVYYKTGPHMGAVTLRDRFVIIDRDTLPEVEHGDLNGRKYVKDVGHPYTLHSRFVDVDPDRIEAEARSLLAIAARLREHTPVDEEQVKAIRGVLDQTENVWYGGPQREAEALYRLGVRVEKGDEVR